MKMFSSEIKQRLEANAQDSTLKNAASRFMVSSTLPKYSYNFSWLGRPIIQYPQDIVGMQELIWKIKPTLIIETGIAHGGSLIFSASMLALLDHCETSNAQSRLKRDNPPRRVIGIDVDIRDHNSQEIETHPLASYIEMLEGSSTSESIISKVKEIATNHERILVCLDSHHSHEHVLAELHAYSSIVTVGSYCVVFDTIIEDLPDNAFPDRDWGPGNNPKTAVNEFLNTNSDFEMDLDMDNKLLISVAPNGYLKKLK